MGRKLQVTVITLQVVIITMLLILSAHLLQGCASTGTHFWKNSNEFQTTLYNLNGGKAWFIVSNPYQVEKKMTLQCHLPGQVKETLQQLNVDLPPQSDRMFGLRLPYGGSWSCGLLPRK